MFVSGRDVYDAVDSCCWCPVSQFLIRVEDKNSSTQGSTNICRFCIGQMVKQIYPSAIMSDRVELRKNIVIISSFISVVAVLLYFSWLTSRDSGVAQKLKSLPRPQLAYMDDRFRVSSHKQLRCFTTESHIFPKHSSALAVDAVFRVWCDGCHTYIPYTVRIKRNNNIKLKKTTVSVKFD